MTGHLGYESTGLNALRGQNNVQGLNDSGANPTYLPGYQPVDDPEIRRKFSEAWGVEMPAAPGYRLDQIISGLHDGRVKALYLIGENPAQTEPNAHHVEEGLVGRRLHRLAGHLPQRLVAPVRGRRPAGVELRGEGRHVHEHRAAREPRAQGARHPGRGARGLADRVRAGAGARRRLARLPEPEEVWNEYADLAPNWYGIRYDRLEEQGIQWPCTDLDDPGTQFLHAPAPALPGGRGRFFPVEYQPPIEPPDSEYPLVLSTGRTLYHYNSATMTMREDGITDKQERPFFEIHRDDAAALGIADGDLARLVSRRGRARGACALLRARLSRASSGWRSTSRRRR